MWNLVGRPAISLPLHWHAEGAVDLPVGIMLGGGFGAEELLLSLAGELEQARPWAPRYAGLWASMTGHA
jgi:amidase